jgi:uncharacterized protein (DUF2384 family)
MKTTKIAVPSARGKRAGKSSLVKGRKSHAVRTVRFEGAKNRASANVLAVREPTGRSGSAVAYRHTKGVDRFVDAVASATPIELVETERAGVSALFLKDLSNRIGLPAIRVYRMLGVPKATAAKKFSSNALISGSGGQSAIGLAKLISAAQEIVANSTAPEAEKFDAAKWLGKWLERSQPSLGGRTPGELLDTPTGIDIVMRLLRSLESGAYQ